MTDPLDKLELGTAELEALLELRGGCHCTWPNAAPPCRVCTDPITVEEAIALDLIPDPDDHY